MLLLLLMVRPGRDVFCSSTFDAADAAIGDTRLGCDFCSSPGVVAAVDDATLLVCEREEQPQKRWD